MVEEDKSGTKPLYRSRDWNAKERQSQKLDKKRNWWNNSKSKIQYKSVLFVTPTPGGVLMKEVQQREEELNKNNDERILVVEKGGLKVKDKLCSKNPFKKSECEQKACPLCSESEHVKVPQAEIKVMCNTNNVGYRWCCVTCEERNTIKVYEGETSRSARLRGAEHLKQLEQKSEKSVLFKHKMAAHQHEQVIFRMDITGKFKDALTRQANESVRISSRPSHELLNSKSEFNHPPHSQSCTGEEEAFQTLVCGTAQSVKTIQNFN